MSLFFSAWAVVYATANFSESASRPVSGSYSQIFWTTSKGGEVQLPAVPATTPESREGILSNPSAHSLQGVFAVLLLKFGPREEVRSHNVGEMISLRPGVPFARQDDKANAFVGRFKNAEFQDLLEFATATTPEAQALPFDLTEAAT